MKAESEIGVMWSQAIKKLPENNIRSYVQELKFRRDRFKGHGKSKITENILKEKL